MTSGLPPEADIVTAARHVSKVPLGEVADLTNGNAISVSNQKRYKVEHEGQDPHAIQAQAPMPSRHPPKWAFRRRTAS